MPRWFLALAALAVFLLLLGLGSRPIERPGLSMALAVHGLAFAWLGTMARRVKGFRSRLGLPDWVAIQAVKNFRKVWPGQVTGLCLLGLAGWSRSTGSDQGWIWVVSGLSLGFQVVGFAGEFAAMASQARLVGELRILSVAGVGGAIQSTGS